MVTTQQFFDNSDDAFLIIDTTGTIRYSNKEAENLLGYSESELMDKNLLIFMPTRHQQIALEGINAFVAARTATSEVRKYDVFAVTKNGEELPVTLTFRSYDRDGDYYIIGSCAKAEYDQVILQELHYAKKTLEETLRRLEMVVTGTSRISQEDGKLVFKDE